MNIFTNLSNWYFTKASLPYWIILFLDSVAVVFSGYLGIYIEHGGFFLVSHFWMFTGELLLSLIIFILTFRIFHTYSGVIRYSSFGDLARIFAANVISGLILMVASFCAWKFLNVSSDCIMGPRTIIVLMISSTMVMMFVRVTVKTLFDSFRVDSSTVKAFVYGVKTGGVAIAKSLQTQNPRKYVLAGFVDPENSFPGQYLMGARVYPDDNNVTDVIRSQEARVLIVSPVQIAHFREREQLITDLFHENIKILMIPEAEEWDGKSELSHKKLKEVEIEDLLPRAAIEVDMKSIAEQFSNTRILITGAAGSIGSEMVRQVALFNPTELILVDQAETPMHDIRLMMASKFPSIKAQTIVASITSQEKMEQIFSRTRPDYVFHAAAYKHVPMMEDNPSVAILNNVRGTRIIADLSVKYSVKKFVMISTDKAVNPTNVMGCSKRICEIYCQSLNQAIDSFVKSGEKTLPTSSPIYKLNPAPVTQFVTTRFGNVLGSNGSVIPIFKEQIRRGGPVTVTSPDIIRYFMLIPEACKLVLEAGTIGKGGQILVFDMGMPVKIADLAKRMIALSGAHEVKIEYTGLREGEKLYEEVLSEKENTVPTSNPKIMVAKVREYDYATALENEDSLLDVALKGDPMEIVALMKEIVPEYKSNNSVYSVLDK